MQFGHIESGISDIDFTLPLDSELTTKTLAGAKGGNDLQVYVGGTKWHNISWLGRTYPRKAKEADFLTLYANNFNTIEFGPTFYNIYKPEEMAKWTDKVNSVPGFTFCPKFPQTISHIRRLKNADEATFKFYDSLKGLGDNCGPLLLQLGDNFTHKSFPDLEQYLIRLPKTRKVFLEIRHKEWFSDKIQRDRLFSLLHVLGIGAVITDAAGRRDCVHMELPTPEVTIRFLGNNLDKSDFKRIDDWVSRFKSWKEQGLQTIWFFMHQHEDRSVPQLCDYLISALNEELDLELKRPKLEH